MPLKRSKEGKEVDFRLEWSDWVLVAMSLEHMD